MEHHRNFFWCFVSYIKDTIHKAFCVKTVIMNFLVFSVFIKFFIEFFFSYMIKFSFQYDFLFFFLRGNISFFHSCVISQISTKFLHRIFTSEYGQINTSSWHMLFSPAEIHCLNRQQIESSEISDLD